MSVIFPNYYTIREAIGLGLVDFSARHLKRLIIDQLTDENNSTAQYVLINGIKTIILHDSLLKSLKRKRIKGVGTAETKYKEVVTATTLTEVTINFKNDYYKSTLNEIFKTYPSKREFKFVTEGSVNHNHIHMMVQDNTSTAKQKIENLLSYHKIDVKDVDILIRPINCSKKFIGYMRKFGEVITHSNSIETPVFYITGNSTCFSPYGTVDFNRGTIFNYKRNKRKILYQF